MKNNAAMRQQPAAVPVRDRGEQAPAAQPGPAAQPASGDTAPAGAPERTVMRELHRMFALIAIR